MRGQSEHEITFVTYVMSVMWCISEKKKQKILVYLSGIDWVVKSGFDIQIKTFLKWFNWTVQLTLQNKDQYLSLTRNKNNIS